MGIITEEFHKIRRGNSYTLENLNSPISRRDFRYLYKIVTIRVKKYGEDDCCFRIIQNVNQLIQPIDVHVRFEELISPTLKVYEYFQIISTLNCRG